MKNLRIYKLLDLLIEICYLGIIFILPICFAIFFKNNSVFELNKLVFFKILVLSLLLLSVIKFCFYNDLFPVSFIKNHAIKKVFLVIGFYVFVLALMTFFSLDINISFWGSYTWQQGFITHVFYILFFILLFLNIKDRSQIDRIIRTIIFSSIIVCAYGAVQFMGWDIMNWNEKSSRITSTFGQPNILAAFMLMVIPFSVFLLLKNKNKILKIFYFLLLILQILVLLYTYSFSGILGLMAEVIIGIFLWFIYRGFSSFVFGKIFFYRSLALLLLMILVFVFYDFGPLVRKFQVSIAVGGGSVASRINFGKASIDAIKERPFMGYGLETQSDVLLAYYQKDWAVYGDVNSHPARAHNLFFDLLLQGGLIYLIAYLLLLYLFAEMMMKSIRRGDFVLLNYSIFIALSGYLTILFFQFQVLSTEVYFWLFLALIFRIYVGFDKEDDIIYNRYTKYKIIKILFVLIVFLSVLFSMQKEINKLMADYYFREMKISHFNNDFFRSVVLYEYLRGLNIRDDYYLREYSLMLSDWIPRLAPYGLVFVDTGNGIIRDILNEIRTNNYSDKFFRALAFTTLADDEHLEYYDWADNLFNELEVYSPHMTMYYYEHARMKSKKGDDDAALNYYQKALSTLPDLDNPHLNKGHGDVVKYHMYLNYLGLADLYVKMEDIEKAKENYLSALEYNSNDEVLKEKINSL